MIKANLPKKTIVLPTKEALKYGKSARVSNKIIDNPVIRDPHEREQDEHKKGIREDSLQEEKKWTAELDKGNGSVFHREKAVRDLETNKIHRASDYGLKRFPHHEQIRKAAGLSVSNSEVGFIGHDHKFYSDDYEHSTSGGHGHFSQLVKDYVMKHGYPKENVNFSRKNHDSLVARFHEAADDAAEKFDKKKYKNFAIRYKGKVYLPKKGDETHFDIQARELPHKKGWKYTSWGHPEEEGTVMHPVYHGYVTHEGEFHTHYEAKKAGGLKEDNGAGFWGTSTLTHNLEKETPGSGKPKSTKGDKYPENKFIKPKRPWRKWETKNEETLNEFEGLRQRKGKEVERALSRAGWSMARQKGSHQIWAKSGMPNYVHAFAGNEEIHSPMMARIAKKTGLKPEHN